MPDPVPNSAHPAPEACIVCVEPEMSRWRDNLCPTRAYLKFLSDGITWADTGRYSHNVLKRDTRTVDARTSDDPLDEADVAIRQYAGLEALPRELGFYEYAGKPEDALARVWRTIVGELGLPDPQPGPEADLSDDPPNFSFRGLLRIGVILLQRGRWLGRLLTNWRRDSPGYFCSELIAKGFAETEGVDLIVEVERWRLPDNVKTRTSIVKAMVARSTPFGGRDVQVAEDTLRETFEGQVDDLFRAFDENRAAGGEDVALPIKVGYRPVGSDARLFPPMLVTPNDLARSPSLRFVDSKCGSITPDNHCSIDRTLWEQRGRATRRILWGLKVSFLASLLLLVLLLTRLIPATVTGLIAAVLVAVYAVLCWRTKPPAPAPPPEDDGAGSRHLATE